MSDQAGRKEKTRVRVTVDWIVGCALLLIGLLGFVLPILQGWIFVLAGLAVLGSHSRRIDRLNRSIRTGLDMLRKRLFRRGSPPVLIPDPVPAVLSEPHPRAAEPEKEGWTG